MANLNTDPIERTNGHYLGRKDIGMTVRTNANVTAIEPEHCAYCGQELVFEVGKGHLPHEHKPLVTNKAGEPYVVAWDGPKKALVFHPNSLEFYTIWIDTRDNLTCRGKSSGERCWDWHKKGSSCLHCDAVEASIDAGERPSLAASIADVEATIAKHERLAFSDDPMKPARKEPRYTLESLYEEPLTRAEEKRAAWYAGKGGFGK